MACGERRVIVSVATNNIFCFLFLRSLKNNLNSSQLKDFIFQTIFILALIFYAYLLRAVLKIIHHVNLNYFKLAETF